MQRVDIFCIGISSISTDVADDVVCRAEIEHLLRLGNTADQRTCETAPLENQSGLGREAVSQVSQRICNLLLTMPGENRIA